MPQAALLGCPPDLVAAWVPAFEAEAIEVDDVPSLWALTAFKLREVDVVVVGPDVARPVAVALRVTRRETSVPILVADVGQRLETLRSLASSTPMLPRHVRLVDASDPAAVARAIVDATRLRRLREGVRRGREQDEVTDRADSRL